MGIINGKYKEINPKDFIKKRPILLRSSIILPSQYNSYAICVEFAKEWFLEKFHDNYFNSVYVEGKYSFDEFRKFSSIDDKMRRANPLLAIIPTIDMTLNRDWIDSRPEIPALLRRSRFEGVFFSDINENGCATNHLQILFKTITTNFQYKIRLDTRAEQMDIMEFIKIKCRAGFSETRELCLDIHVPKEIIAQIASDKGFELDSQLNVKKPIEFLKYLNNHSYIPFIYKLRCASGNNEFFIKVPNCVVRVKSELPSMDDGERQDMLTTNFTVDFDIEMEMTAPMEYCYYSQCDHKFINTKPTNLDGAISVMRSVLTQVPQYDEHKWKLVNTTEYLIEENDLHKELEIDFNDYFDQTDLKDIIIHTRNINISPSVFINFKFFNDGFERCYDMNWESMKCKIIGDVDNITTVIGVYCNMGYINNELSNMKDLESNRLH